MCGQPHPIWEGRWRNHKWQRRICWKDRSALWRWTGPVKDEKQSVRAHPSLLPQTCIVWLESEAGGGSCLEWTFDSSEWASRQSISEATKCMQVWVTTFNIPGTLRCVTRGRRLWRKQCYSHLPHDRRPRHWSPWSISSCTCTEHNSRATPRRQTENDPENENSAQSFSVYFCCAKFQIKTYHFTCSAEKRPPWYFPMISNLTSLSSYHATGVSKSRGFANPFAPVCSTRNTWKCGSWKSSKVTPTAQDSKGCKMFGSQEPDDFLRGGAHL